MISQPQGGQQMPRNMILSGSSVPASSACRTALYLQRAGQGGDESILVPAGGASFGNAGMFSPDTATPIAMPGMLRKVPGWLRDPLGPLAVHPSTFRAPCRGCCNGSRPAGCSAFWRYPTRCARCTATHWPAGANCWATVYRDLIRPSGQVHVWEGDDAARPRRSSSRSATATAFAAQTLNADDLRQMFPGSPVRSRAGCSSRATVTPSVRSASCTLAELFRAAGGTMITERAMKLIPREGGG